jgi:hypothetical protein
MTAIIEQTTRNNPVPNSPMASSFQDRIICKSMPSTPVLTKFQCFAEPSDEWHIQKLLDREEESSDIDDCCENEEYADDLSDSLTVSSYRTMHRRSFADLFEDADGMLYSPKSYREMRESSVVSNISLVSSSSQNNLNNDDEEFLFGSDYKKHRRSVSANNYSHSLGRNSNTLTAGGHINTDRRRRMSVTSQLAQMLIRDHEDDLACPESPSTVSISSIVEEELDGQYEDFRINNTKEHLTISISPFTDELRTNKPKSMRNHPLISPAPMEKKPKAQFFTTGNVNNARRSKSMIRSLFEKSSHSRARSFSMSAKW